MPSRKKPRKPSRPPGKKRGRGKLAAFIMFALLTLCLSVFLGLMDKRLLPAVIRIEEYRLSTRLNQIIDDSLALIPDIREQPLVSSDFYIAVADPGGRIMSLSADTILINEVCAVLSRFINEKLIEFQNDSIHVPLGALLGFEWMANLGPSYRISVMPVGVANVDYESSFTSAGINQINFQVWVTVVTEMQVVNPLQTREIRVTKRIPLVNTVFAGEIPQMYFNKDATPGN